MIDARARLARSFRAAILDRTEWRPVSDQPKEGQVTVLRCGARSATGKFKNGAWTNAKGKALPFEPTHWLAILDG